MQRHEFDRFRQTDHCGDGDDDRHDAADQEQDLPAVLRHENRRHKSRNGAAERHAADAYNRQRGAQLARRGLGIDGDDIGNDTADAQPREQPQPEHLIEVGRIGGGQCEYAEQQIRADQRRFAAIAVAHPAKECRTKENADEAGAEDRTERAWFQGPFFSKARRGEGDGGNIVAVDEDDEERPDEQLDLERAQAALVEQPRYLNDWLIRHCSLPRAIFVLYGPLRPLIECYAAGEAVKSGVSRISGWGGRDRQNHFRRMRRIVMNGVAANLVGPVIMRP
jgi:hypothetical protein